MTTNKKPIKMGSVLKFFPRLRCVSVPLNSVSGIQPWIHERISQVTAMQARGAAEAAEGKLWAPSETEVDL
jgi:hypothetical protein